jgi:aspartate-semialdehyde dehydrogenase
LTVETLTEDSFEGVDIVLSSAGGSISKQFVPAAVHAGAVVIDNTSAFRMDEGVPLVVPEVNADALAGHKGVIANPNCSTIQMVVALNPIHQAAKIRRLVISTYQAASGAGQAAIDELLEHTRLALDGKPLPAAKKFPHSLAFNCIPQVDVFLESGYSKEEMKMVHETRKIMSAPEMRITATTVRVPVLRSHSESINIETERKLSAAEARRLLESAPGVIVRDDPAAGVYPLASESTNRDATYVGRIREDDSIDNGLNIWVVSDQIRKGAALNSLQIAEIMIERGLVKPAAAARR